MIKIIRLALVAAVFMVAPVAITYAFAGDTDPGFSKETIVAKDKKVAPVAPPDEQAREAKCIPIENMARDAVGTAQQVHGSVMEVKPDGVAKLMAEWNKHAIVKRNDVIGIVFVVVPNPAMAVVYFASKTQACILGISGETVTAWFQGAYPDLKSGNAAPGNDEPKAEQNATHPKTDPHGHGWALPSDDSGWNGEI